MPTTKHELLDWLMDVPEDAEIGTDGQGLALLAILGTNVHLLEVGRIPNADELYAEAINQAILERLLGGRPRRISANYSLVGLRAVENLRIVEFVCELFDKAFRLFCILENKRRIEVSREQARNA